MTREENINNVGELISIVQELASELNDEFTTYSETLESPNKKENEAHVYAENNIFSRNNPLAYATKLYETTQMVDPIIIIRDPAGKTFVNVFQINIQSEHC